jgi:hypothetical protein
VLELVVETQAPYDSTDDVAISYDSLANLDDIHHGAASDKRAPIDHVASMAPKNFPDRDGIATAQRTDPSSASIITSLESTAPSKLTRNEYALSDGLLVRLPNRSTPGVGWARLCVSQSMIKAPLTNIITPPWVVTLKISEPMKSYVSCITSPKWDSRYLLYVNLATLANRPEHKNQTLVDI